VPQTKAALFARDGRITLRTVLGKFFCTSVTLASGIPLGREGPSVQVGAGIGSVLGRLLGLSTEQVKKLIPVGAAAAIAAAFNTPLAAVVFSLEEIMGDLNAPVMGGVVLASATAWMVLRSCWAIIRCSRSRNINWSAGGVCGLCGAGRGRRRGLGGLREALAGDAGALPAVPAEDGLVSTGGGRIAGGLMGWFVPQVLGVGYGFVGDALNGKDGVPPDAAAAGAEAVR
jgi:CIC family chloride channel protein